MAKTYLLLITLFIVGLNPLVVFSQDTSNPSKLLDHYVGIQINELVKQVLNLSSNESPEHPYYLNYALNHSKTGWGINSGFGYIINSTNEGDAINKVETEINQLSFRIGPEKKIYLGKKMILAVGLDYIIYQNRNKSVTRIEQGQDQFVETTVEEITLNNGFGPRLSFSYRLSKYILIGTEASYYYSKEKVSQRTDILSSFNNSETKEEHEDEFSNKYLNFLTPTVLFVVFQF